jgi:hypothetical protein
VINKYFYPVENHNFLIDLILIDVRGSRSLQKYFAKQLKNDRDD